MGINVTYSCDTLRWLSEWKTFPSQVIGWLADKVDNTLLTGGALDRAVWFAREHSILFFRTLLALTLGHQQIVQVLDLSAQIR